MIQATSIRPGMIIMHNNELHRVVEVHHLAPGNWRAMVQTKLKNLNTGNQSEYRFRSDEKIEKVALEITEMEYLYNENDSYYFMDTTSFEQISINKEILGDNVYYLLSNTKVRIDIYENKPVGLELPQTVDLKIIKTDPALRGATQTGSFKPATLETGLVIQVPQFVETGDTVKVDTATNKYLERII